MRTTIKTPSEEDIYIFFLSLSDQTLYNFTLYPNSNNPKVALGLSKTLLKEKNQKIFGLFRKEEMVGFGILKFFAKKSRLHICQLGIAIGDQHQRKGYGNNLLKNMTDWAKKNKYEKIWLNVYSDNIRAIKLYRDFGFQREGIFMYDEYFKNKPRHSISMALFFNVDPHKERRKLWENLSKTLALR